MNQERNNNRSKSKGRASLKKSVRLIENRTVSNQRVAKAENSFANRVSKSSMRSSAPRNLGAESFLTIQELDHHESVKRGSRARFALLNENIEQTEVKQQFTTSYEFGATAAVGGGFQVTLMSTCGQDPSCPSAGDTPKAFGSLFLKGVGSAIGTGLPGPCARSDVVQPSSCVLTGSLSTGTLALKTTSAVSGFMLAKDAITACPFGYDATTGAHALRWQPVCIRVRTENVTIGSNRGGVGYLIQPTNALEGSTVERSQLMNKGIYRVYDDGEISEPKNENGFATLEPRSGLCSFSGMRSDFETTESIGDAMCYIVLDNPSGVAQAFKVFIEIDWQLGGTLIRGIGSPHIVPASAQDRAREANQVMRSANILPSDQRGKESIPAGLALHASPALQSQLSGGRPIPRVGDKSAHPVLSHVKKFLGKHLHKIAEIGMEGAIAAASRLAR